LGIAGPHPSENMLRANSKDNVILSRSRSSNSLMGKDVGDDILVWRDEKETARKPTNPFEESDEEKDLPQPRGRSRTKASSPNQRGILKKNQNTDENFNEEVSRAKTVKKSLSRSPTRPTPNSIRDGLKIPELPKSRARSRSRSKSPSVSPLNKSSKGKLDYDSQDTIPSAITKYVKIIYTISPKINKLVFRRNPKSSTTAKHYPSSRIHMPVSDSCTTVKDVPVRYKQSFAL
jgi:hypothetical protein